jgi:hypothetical protein
VSATRIQKVDPWPPLPLAEWQPTYRTLHMWTQIVGKVKMALAPPENHWWHVTLRVSARGLTTGAMPYGKQALEIEFDFIDHTLQYRTSTGEQRQHALRSQPVADFWDSTMATLKELGLSPHVWDMPVEVEDPIPLDKDREHATYVPDHANRFWRVLLASWRVMSEFRGRFIGKCSPVHFFWGSFDLAVTRFSGRPAPAHPGAPHVPLHVAREAYSHEVSSCGFWPGGGPVSEPVYYAYAYPEPEGFKSYTVRPGAAYYSNDLREFVLPYETVRTSSSPEAMLLDFLQSTYEAAAELGKWDRAALERSEGAASAAP